MEKLLINIKLGEVMKAQISQWQLSLLVIGAITVMGHIFIVPLVLDKAGKDVWLSLLVALVPGIVLVMVLSWLTILKPQKTLDQIAAEQFGKLIGKMVSFMYALYFLLPAVLGLRGLMEFMVTAFLKHTPKNLIGLIFLALCLFAVKSGLESIARVYAILMTILIVSGILATSLASPDKEFQKLLPVLEHGMLPVLLGSIPLIGLLGEMVVIGGLLGSVRNSAAIWQGNLVAILVIGLFFVGPLTGPVAMFGEVATNFDYPTFAEMKFGSYLSYFQSLAVVLWLLGSFGRIALFYYTASESAARIFNLTNNQPLVVPIGVLIYLLTLFAFPDLVTVKKFLVVSYPVMGVTLGILIPTVLLLSIFIKKALEGGSWQSKPN